MNKNVIISTIYIQVNNQLLQNANTLKYIVRTKLD